jgi:hypothetical protein
MKRTLLIALLIVMSLVSARTFACTTFLISGKYTADGKPLLFKNRDTDEMQNSLAFFTDGRYRYIGLVDGKADWNKMVWGGYNETGFAVMNSAAYTNNIGDTSKYMDQEGVVMKLALQSCRTLEDFENMLASMPKPLGVDANFGVIDAYGGAAFYETGNYTFKKVDANDATIAPDGLLVRTNHSMNDNIREGYGFCRYNTAVAALSLALQEKKMTPRYLFDYLSRNLYHSLTGTDLKAEMPDRRDTPEFKFFIDYIPRVSTASAILIVGAQESKKAVEAMMWTILGFPLTSVAVPVWIAAGGQLPRAVTMDTAFRSPLCTAALKFKEDCFPITYDRGWNYINLSAVINKENSGYMQLLQPVEGEIFSRADLLAKEIARGVRPEKEIPLFYAWIDQYLSEKYMELFNYNLFND